MNRLEESAVEVMHVNQGYIPTQSRLKKREPLIALDSHRKGGEK